jgi:hypothetical protein
MFEVVFFSKAPKINQDLIRIKGFKQDLKDIRTSGLTNDREHLPLASRRVVASEAYAGLNRLKCEARFAFSNHKT